jgi:hypothetical protein
MGEHFVILFYIEKIPDYIGVPGTNATGTVGGANATKLNNINWNNGNENLRLGIRHSLYNYNMVNAENYSYKSNPDGTTATVTRNKDTCILGSENTPFTWTIKENCSTRNVMIVQQKDILRAEALYAQNEWLRHRASIVATNSNGNITTNLANGTMADRVDIVTENGEMYFKIIVNENDSEQDILTNNLAKYNMHSFCSGNIIS